MKKNKCYLLLFCVSLGTLFPVLGQSDAAAFTGDQLLQLPGKHISDSLAKLFTKYFDLPKCEECRSLDGNGLRLNVNSDGFITMAKVFFDKDTKRKNYSYSGQLPWNLKRGMKLKSAKKALGKAALKKNKKSLIFNTETLNSELYFSDLQDKTLYEITIFYNGALNPKTYQTDSDKDGVWDYKDDCPGFPGYKYNNGCGIGSIYDGWPDTVFNREFVKIYDDYAQGFASIADFNSAAVTQLHGLDARPVSNGFTGFEAQYVLSKDNNPENNTYVGVLVTTNNFNEADSLGRLLMKKITMGGMKSVIDGVSDYSYWDHLGLAKIKTKRGYLPYNLATEGVLVLGVLGSRDSPFKDTKYAIILYMGRNVFY